MSFTKDVHGNLGSVCSSNHDHVSRSQFQRGTLRLCVVAMIKNEAEPLSKRQTTSNDNLSLSFSLNWNFFSSRVSSGV